MAYLIYGDIMRGLIKATDMHPIQGNKAHKPDNQPPQG
jgi:hypothetical protein